MIYVNSAVLITEHRALDTPGRKDLSGQALVMEKFMDKYLKTRIETISEKDFWSSIRPNRETRAAVAAGLAGQRAPAYRLLGDYHARTLAAEAEALGQSAHAAADPDAVKQAADRVMRHEIQGWHTHVRQFGPVIDFNADYGRSGQYGFHYMTWLQPVVNQYVVSGQTPYRDEFISIVKQYYAQRTDLVHRIPHLHPVYYELGARAKTQLMVPAYAYLAHDPALDSEAREALLKLILGFARSLYRLQNGGYRAGNWQIVGCQTLYGIGAAFPEFREAVRWRQRAEAIITEHAKRDFFSDGGHSERCWGYGLMSLQGMEKFYTCALRYQHLDARQRAWWSRFLQRGYRWFAATTAPGLMMLNYGDGQISSARHIIGKAERQFPALKRGPGLLGVDRSRSAILRPSGYAFMRCGDAEKAPFMSINFGKWGGGHTHQDLLDFTVWRYGQPLIEEVGRFGSYDNPLDPCFHAAESHNQVVLDHHAMDRPAHEGREVYWFSDSRVDLFSAWHQAYGKVRIQRQIVFFKPDAWLIYDVVTAAEYIFQATHCLHGVRPFLSTGPGRWRLQGRPSCLVAVAHPERIRRVETGVDYDRADYGPLAESTPAYQHERHRLRLSSWQDVGSRRPITFATLLVPFSGKPPAVSLQPLPIRGDTTGQAGAFNVQLNGQRYRAIFNPAGEDLTVGSRHGCAIITAGVGRQWIDSPLVSF